MATSLMTIPVFKKDKKLLDGAADATFEIKTTSSVLELALSSDQPFPAGTVRLGNIDMGLAGNSGDLRFGSIAGQPSVSFQGSAKGGGLLAAYAASPDLLQDLGADGFLTDGVSFEDAGTQRYVALSWNYDINGAATGAMAFGAVANAKFGVEGSSGGRFAVIRRYGQDPPAATAVQGVIDAWRLPRQVDRADDLPPGTWLVAELNGGLKGSLGVQAGFDYSWLRSVQLQGLSGDIGLKIQAAAAMTLGFELAGKYALVVSRDSLDAASHKIRVRVRKLAKNGWDFALNAAVGVQGSTGTFLPGSLDDFLRGIFGVHGAQVVEDLKLVRTWTNPNIPLNTMAGAFLLDLAKQHFQQDIDKALESVKSFLDQWNQLSHATTSQLLALAQSAKTGTTGADPTAALRAFLQTVAGTSPDQLRSLILERLQTASTAPSIEVLWLESIAADSVLSLVQNSALLQTAQMLAQASLGVLDSEPLDLLAQWLNTRFDIAKIRNLSLDQIDQWLKDKLSKLLGIVIDELHLEDVRKAIDSILNKADSIYAAALKAAQQKYEFDLAATYQSSTERTLLFDGIFDFDANPGLSDVLKQCINGDLTRVLTTPIDGVVLQQAALSHGIRKQSQLALTLPFMKLKTGSLTESLAQLQVSAEGSRIALSSSNQVYREGEWTSRLALTANVALGTVHQFSLDDSPTGSASVTYSYAVAQAGLRTVGLAQRVKPLADLYLPAAFGNGRATVDDWAADLDKNADALENNGTGLIGNTLLILESSLPGTVFSGWWNAPKDKKAPVYQQLSKAIQTRLRTLLHFVYFLDPKHYRGQQPAACAVMLYRALPVACTIKPGTPGQPQFDTGKDVYWDWLDRRPEGDFTLMTTAQRTVAALGAQMEQAHRIVENTPEIAGDAGFYVPDELRDVFRTATTGTGSLLINALLSMEAHLISEAVNAASIIGSVRDAKKVDDVVAALDQFGAKVVEAFNQGLTDLFDPKNNPQLLRNLGLMIFAEASRVLSGSAVTVQPLSRLTVSILKSSATFPPKGFPLTPQIGDGDIVLSQPVLSEIATA